MAESPSFHESFARTEKPAAGSDKSFCLVFAAVFAVIAVMNRGAFLPLWAALSAGFLLLAYTRPAYAAPLNRLWARFGQQLHRVMNPLVLTLLYAIAILPLGLAMRALGKNKTQAPDPSLQSYWIPRAPAAPETMRDQF